MEVTSAKGKYLKYRLLAWQILDDALAGRTVDLAVKYGTTIHDGSYLALGEQSVVYTADGRLARKVADDRIVASFRTTSHISFGCQSSS